MYKRVEVVVLLRIQIFFGFKVIEHESMDDEFSIYSFELKISNSIRDISSAISQAINYKKFSNLSYIVIPVFHEAILKHEFIDQCFTNGIGIISILIGDKGVLGVEKILEAKRSRFGEHKWIDELLTGKFNGLGYHLCPLCRKINKADSTERCGFKNGDVCIKTCLKKGALNSLNCIDQE